MISRVYCPVFLSLFFFFFLMWTIFKVFIEFVIILLLFYVLVFWPWGMWDLSTPTGIEPVPPALEGKVSTTGPPGKSLPCLLTWAWPSMWFALVNGRLAKDTRLETKLHFTTRRTCLGNLLFKDDETRGADLDPTYSFVMVNFMYQFDWAMGCPNNW